MIDADEMFQYRQEHVKIHGHLPVPALDGSRFCIHPNHDFVERIGTAPGVDVEIPFDFHPMHTEDDEEIVAMKRAYDARVEQIREQIAEADEMDAFKARENKKRLF